MVGSANPRSCSASFPAPVERSGSPGSLGPRAKEITRSGRQLRLSPRRRRSGLSTASVAATEVEHAAVYLAGDLAKGAVAAMGLAKRVIDDGLGVPLAQGLDPMERDAFVEVFATEDAASGVKSFLEKKGRARRRFRGAEAAYASVRRVALTVSRRSSPHGIANRDRHVDALVGVRLYRRVQCASRHP